MSAETERNETFDWAHRVDVVVEAAKAWASSPYVVSADAEGQLSPRAQALFDAVAALP